ncbi:MAG: class I SAM-dependent methyltransferase [Anaerolineales bacterium]|nr:class I SAM-dependent methyltransferase [Anaerolineales bacterium]
MMENNVKTDVLFTSATQMAEADNYNDWTFDLFKPYVKGKVLEVGCGVGSFTKRFIQQGSFQQMLSIDISQDAVSYCQARFVHSGLEFQCIDLLMVRGKFDMIVCMNVLEHIEDHKGALAHLYNLLNPGGILFLLVPAHQALYSPFDVAAGHYRRYNKKMMAELLSTAVSHTRYRLTQFYFNAVGALGYGFVYKVMKKAPKAEAQSEIGAFDKLVVPVMRNLESKFIPFGISLITIVTKEK